MWQSSRVGVFSATPDVVVYVGTFLTVFLLSPPLRAIGDSSIAAAADRFRPGVTGVGVRGAGSWFITGPDVPVLQKDGKEGSWLDKFGKADVGTREGLSVSCAVSKLIRSQTVWTSLK